MPTPLDAMSAWVPEHGKRQSKASAKVTDAVNTSKSGLKSHQAARDLAEASAASESWTSTSAVKRKQPLTACVLDDVKDDPQHHDDDSHVLPKGFILFYSIFLIELKCFFLASASKKSCVKQSDNEIEEVSISMLIFF